MANLDALRELFQTVIGRPPVGKAVSTKARAASELRLTQRAVAVPGIRIPDVLVNFHSVFGGEKEAITKYYHLAGINVLGAGLSHVIFASDPRSGLSYGVDHNNLEYDDPVVEVVRTADRDDLFEWRRYCFSLDNCLVQFTSRNLTESMPYDLFVDDTTVPHFQADIAAYRTIPLTESGEGGVHCQPYYAPGTIIVVDPENNTAMIGLDSLERALAFQSKHDWGFPEHFEPE
jgi:hypothetical protein